MNNTIVCEHCSHSHKFSGELPIGKNATCAACKKRFIVGLPKSDPPIFIEIKQDAPTARKKKLMSHVATLSLDTISGISCALIYMVFACFALCVLVGVPMAIMHDPSSDFSDRFLRDNATGATANAIERLVLEVRSIRSAISIVSVIWLVPKLFTAFKKLDAYMTSAFSISDK
jgi:hypothetical protein